MTIQHFLVLHTADPPFSLLFSSEAARNIFRSKMSENQPNILVFPNALLFIASSISKVEEDELMATVGVVPPPFSYKRGAEICHTDSLPRK